MASPQLALFLKRMGSFVLGRPKGGGRVVMGLTEVTRIGAMGVASILLLAVSGWADNRPEELKGIGIKEHLGAQVKLDELSFRDEQGTAHTLSDYFKSKKPVILTLVYYQCPMLCNLVLNGLLEGMKKIEWSVGNQYEIVTVSINPHEREALARKKKSTYIGSYGRPGAEAGWHFLTGDEPAIEALASQVGFEYRYDPDEKQYAHAAAIFILTPDGKVSRYLYGTDFQAQTLKLGLLEASSGKISLTTLDRVLLFCFHFDPYKNSYTLKMWRVVQLVLSIQLLVLGGFLWKLWRKKPA